MRAPSLSRWLALAPRGVSKQANRQGRRTGGGSGGASSWHTSGCRRVFSSRLRCWEGRRNLPVGEARHSATRPRSDDSRARAGAKAVRDKAGVCQSQSRDREVSDQARCRGSALAPPRPRDLGPGIWVQAQGGRSVTVLSPSGARALTWGGGGQAQLATRLSARRGGRESPACPFGTAWEAPDAPLLLASLLAAALAGRTELGLGGGGWVCVELGPDEREWGRIEDDREARVYCDDAFASARSTRMMLRGTLEARRAPAPRAAGTRSPRPPQRDVPSGHPARPPPPSRGWGEAPRCPVEKLRASGGGDGERDVRCAIRPRAGSSQHHYLASAAGSRERKFPGRPRRRTGVGANVKVTGLGDRPLCMITAEKIK